MILTMKKNDDYDDDSCHSSCFCLLVRVQIQHRVEHLSSTEDAATEAYRGNELLKLAEDGKSHSCCIFFPCATLS